MPLLTTNIYEYSDILHIKKVKANYTSIIENKFKEKLTIEVLRSRNHQLELLITLINRQVRSVKEKTRIVRLPMSRHNSIQTEKNVVEYCTLLKKTQAINN